MQSISLNLRKQGHLPMDLVGKRVAVIGAGNTAIDAATCSVRMGAELVQDPISTFREGNDCL